MKSTGISKHKKNVEEWKRWIRQKNRLRVLLKNVGINVGINKTEKAVLSILIRNPEKTAEEMATEVGVTKRTIERTLVNLKKKGLVERIGSNKSGSWSVVR